MDNSLKFDGSEFAGQDVASLPDTPNEAGFTAAELKARFDNVGKMLIALGKHNDLVDALTAQTAASGIGATADNGDPTTVQALIENNQIVPYVYYYRKYGVYDHNPKRITNASITDALNWLADTVRVAIGEIFDGIELTGDGGAQSIWTYAGFPKDGFTQVVNFVNNRVTARETEIAALTANVLGKDNAEDYTPTGDYNPATKKYVDDTVTAIGAGDMRKAAYDTTNTGNKVDTARNAEKLGGVAPSGYQRALTFDSAPTAGSTNPVTSGGVFDAGLSAWIGFSADTTVAAEHNGKVLNANGSVTVTLPDASDTDFPIGGWFRLRAQGAGQTPVLKAPSGVTLVAAGGYSQDGGSASPAKPYKSMLVSRRSANQWAVVSGGQYDEYPRAMAVTSSFTLNAGYLGLFLTCRNNDVTVTVPADATSSIPVGGEVRICRNSDKAVTISPASGVTMRSLGGSTAARTISGVYGVVTLKKVAADTWVLYGDLT